MIRFLKAFAWLRWRLLINGLKGGRRRDTIERFSRIAALAAPIFILLLFSGAALFLAVLGLIGGLAIASGSIGPAGALLGVRGTLFAVLIVLVLAPVTFSTTGSGLVYKRLLLLPISRRALHLVEVVATLADPWVVFILPALVTLPAGLLLGGQAGTTLVAVAAAVAFVAVVALLGSLVSFLLSWLLRNRRRGEWFTLVFILGITVVSIVPALFTDFEPSPGSTTTEQKPRERVTIERIENALPLWTRGLPSEIYGRSIWRATEGRFDLAWLLVGALAFEAALLYAISLAVHRKLLESGESDRNRRRAGAVTGRRLRLPGLSPAASAVAITQLRTGLRSVRGRLIVFMPGPLVGLLALLSRRMPDAVIGGSFLGSDGYVAMGAGMVFGLYALQAFNMNQFASDRAGLTLQLLAPISDDDLVRGKAAGCGMIFGATTLLCLISALAVAGSGPPLVWLSVLLGGFATYALISPVAALMSAYFPVVADLSKTGTGGNPHGLAMLLGTFLVLVAWAPAWIILAVGKRVFESPALTLAMMLVWLVVALSVSIPLLRFGSRALSARRENVALVAQGR
ncbi:MAG TPA: hypothetical protein VG778_10240 [Blastocatellia bacterium]|jgi:hypothetical protein|nr:hypothetical protein [Blastocatellia bacterium]